MADGYKNEAERYAASLRQWADWSDECGEPPTVDTDDLRAAADCIERQQAEIVELQGLASKYLYMLGVK